MTKDEVITRLVEEGYDPERVHREVNLAESAWMVDPNGWETSDLWILRARISESPAVVVFDPEPDNAAELEYEWEDDENDQG